MRQVARYGDECNPGEADHSRKVHRVDLSRHDFGTEKALPKQIKETELVNDSILRSCKFVRKYCLYNVTFRIPYRPLTRRPSRQPPGSAFNVTLSFVLKGLVTNRTVLAGI